MDKAEQPSDNCLPRERLFNLLPAEFRSTHAILTRFLVLGFNIYDSTLALASVSRGRRDQSMQESNGRV